MGCGAMTAMAGTAHVALGTAVEGESGTLSQSLCVSGSVPARVDSLADDAAEGRRVQAHDLQLCGRDCGYQPAGEQHRLPSIGSDSDHVAAVEVPEPTVRVTVGLIRPGVATGNRPLDRNGLAILLGRAAPRGDGNPIADHRSMSSATAAGS